MQRVYSVMKDEIASCISTVNVIGSYNQSIVQEVKEVYHFQTCILNHSESDN